MFFDDILDELEEVKKIISNLERIQHNIGRNISFDEEFAPSKIDYFEDYDGEDLEKLSEIAEILINDLQDAVDYTEERMGV